MSIILYKKPTDLWYKSVGSNLPTLYIKPLGRCLCESTTSEVVDLQCVCSVDVHADIPSAGLSAVSKKGMKRTVLTYCLPFSMVYLDRRTWSTRAITESTLNGIKVGYGAI